VHVNRGLLNWGTFFVIVGAIPLLVQGGYLSSSTVADAWRLWPLIIVGIGVGLLLRRTPFRLVGGLIVAATFGLILGSFLAVGPTLSVGCAAGPGGSTVSTADQGSFDGGRADVDLQMNCGTLNVQTGAGSTWSLQARDPQGYPPEITKGSSQLTIRSQDRSELFSSLTRARGEREWQVTLPSEPDLALSLSVNAGKGTIVLGGEKLTRGLRGTFNAADIKVDLSNTALSSLDLSFNAGSGSVTLPSGSTISGTLHANVSAVRLCVPSGVGLQLQVNSSLASNNFGDRGLVQSGSVWTTPDYGSASSTIDLDINANLSSVSLNPAEGCQ
jgi:hypothetical protein